jgi:ubiquinone/menaquinone biosynthesis C-methylase UbiE
LSEWTKKRTVKHRYDITASIYDRRYAEEQTTKIKAAMENVHLDKDGLVLDAGCGTGLLFNHVADKAKTVVGLDISKKSLLKARERSKSSPNVHLVLADADYMPFRDGMFNSVFAMTLIQNAPDPAKTLNEMKRVTKNDSLLTVTGLKKSFSNEVFKKLLRDAGLKTAAFEDGENLKCHVAVCVKIHH